MSINPTIRLVKGIDRRKDFAKSLKHLVSKDVLVGVPRKTAHRSGKGNVNNAMLAYVHDNGSPAQGIPRREFLRPGIKNVQTEIAQRFKQVGRKTLGGDKADLDRGLTAIGLLAQKSVRRKIQAGPFTPLKPATIKARRRRGRTGTRPLIDYGKMLASINFVLRSK